MGSRPKALDPRHAIRFAGELDKCVPQASSLGLAVSGGPDSVAMLLLAHAVRPDRIRVASIDHGLRAENIDEAEEVARLCHQLEVPCQIVRLELGSGGNLQAEARRRRYAALVNWCENEGLAHLATAHHGDDQAETLVMRLNRASGLAGLAGIRSPGRIEGWTGALIRPLLGWRKAELERLVAEAGITPARDPSNTDPRFDRARIRKALQEADWLDVEAVARSACHLQEAERALQWAIEREWREHVAAHEEGGLRYHVREGVPPAIRHAIAAKAIAALGGEAARGGAVAGLVARLAEGGRANLGGVLAVGQGTHWLFSPEPSRRSAHASR